VVKLGTEQALVPPNGRFNFAVPPGRYPIGVCCSSEFQAIHDVVEVVDRDVVLTLVARPLIEITGKISVTGDVPALQGFAISAVLQGTMWWGVQSAMSRGGSVCVLVKAGGGSPSITFPRGMQRPKSTTRGPG
jgi:hypothetical protein